MRETNWDHCGVVSSCLADTYFFSLFLFNRYCSLEISVEFPHWFKIYPFSNHFTTVALIAWWYFDWILKNRWTLIGWNYLMILIGLLCWSYIWVNVGNQFCSTFCVVSIRGTFPCLISLMIKTSTCLVYLQHY